MGTVAAELGEWLLNETEQYWELPTLCPALNVIEVPVKFGLATFKGIEVFG